MKRMMTFASVCLLALAAVADPFDFGSAGFSSVDFGSVGGKGFRSGPKSYEGEPKIVLKECCVCPPLSTNIPDAAVFDRFKFGRKGYFKATYLVLAKNIVDIDLDGLVIESIVGASGKDYAKLKNGEPNWEVDDFRSSVNREAGVATFVLTGGGKVWGKALPKITGKLPITVADKMTTKQFAGKVSSGKIGAGDYQYKLKVGKGFMSEGKTLEVSPIGEKASGEFEVLCAGKKLESRGSMSMNGKVTYSFAAPASDDIVIKVTYPDGGKKLVLPL